MLLTLENRGKNRKASLSIGEGQCELRHVDLTGDQRGHPGGTAPSLAQAPRGTAAELLCGVGREDRKWAL